MSSDTRTSDLLGRLRPRLQELEGRRRGLRNTIVGGIAVALAGVGSCRFAFDVPAALQLGDAARYEPFGFAMLALACFGVAFSRFLVPGVTGHIQYRARFKQEVVAEVVRVVRPGARYFPDRHLRRELFAESRLFREEFDIFRGDDLVQGSVSETPFECSEVEAGYETGSNDSRRKHGVFQGLFLRVDSDRDYAGHTVVQPPDEQGGNREGMQKVALDASFGAAFSVWSTNAGEALALLTPERRGRLLQLADDVGASLHLAFTGRVTYAALHYGRNLLEPRIAAGLDAAELGKLAEPFEVVADVVTALGLDGPRRRPADAAFHQHGFTVLGLEAVSNRIAASGDVGIEALLDATNEDSAAAGQPPASSVARMQDAGASLEISYPLRPGTFLALAIWLALTPVFFAAVANWASPPVGAEIVRLAAERWPPAGQPLSAALAYPTACLLVSGLFFWGFSSGLRHRPVRVSVGAQGVMIRRLFRPWSLLVPAAVIRRIDASNRSVAVVRADRSLLRSMLIAAPNMPTQGEARWVAARMTHALRRAGWSGGASAPGG